MKNEKFDMINEPIAVDTQMMNKLEKRIEWIEKRLNTFEVGLIIVEDRLNGLNQNSPIYPCPSPYPPCPDFNDRSFDDETPARLKYSVNSPSFEKTFQ